jgi:steroid delta-isomerase-like uncharacterized protein
VIRGGIETEGSMPAEENKAIVRRYVAEVWGKHNLAVVDELFAPEYTDLVAIHANTTGREGLKRNLIGFLDAFPDARVTVNDLIAEGDRVVWRWTLQGTHLGEFRGIPATGREITWTGMIIWRILEGHIVE